MPVIRAVAVVGKNNNPLYLRTFLTGAVVEMDDDDQVENGGDNVGPVDVVSDELRDKVKVSAGLVDPFDGGADQELKYQSLVYASLDVIDQKVDSYLGLLYLTEDVTVFGFQSNSKAKLIAVVSDGEVKDADMKSLFRRLHTVYLDAICNPFYHLEAPLVESRSFVNAVARLVSNF